MNQENDIQVSVCVVTYNQENYIAECLESLVTQQTSFKFEIIVGEDCSTDGTRAIVQKYADQYPHLIVPMLYEKNVGAIENIKQVYLKACGKYIAHMDGDDLAIQGKLQRQFDSLELHLDCNVCSHNVMRIDKDGKSLKKNIVFPENKYNLFDLYCHLPFFAHSSKMFRNKYSVSFWDDLLSKDYILDLDIHISNLIDGDIYHIGEYYGKYRVETGISFIARKINPILSIGAERVFEKGKVIFMNDYQKLQIIKKLYARSMLGCAYEYAINDQDIEKFKEYVNKSVHENRIGLVQVFFEFGVIFPKLFFILLKIRDKLRQFKHK